MGMNEAIDPASNPLEPTAFDHTGERPSGDSYFCRQPGGHEAFAFGCERKECVEACLRHVKMLHNSDILTSPGS